MRRDVEFNSDGESVRGSLFLPDGPGPFPGIVMAGGWAYVKEMISQPTAEAFAGYGLAALAFDYRTFGASDGEPREHLNPWWQIEDYRNAISFLETVLEVDNDRIGAWGISVSGGHVLVLGATDPRVRCIVSLVPIIDGHALHRLALSIPQWQRMERAIAEDRRLRFQTGNQERGYLPVGSADPEHELCMFPLAIVHEGYEAVKANMAPNLVTRTTIESVELFHTYSIRPFLHRLTNVPVQMSTNQANELTPIAEELEAFNLIASPDKQLVRGDRLAKYREYADKPEMQLSVHFAAQWFVKYLVEPYV